MKLLQEFLIINENSSAEIKKIIDGNTVLLVLSEVDAERGVYVGKQTYRSTMSSPAEYGDDEDAYLKINSLMFDILNPTNNGNYTLIFDLNNQDFLNDDYKKTFAKKEFISALSNSNPEIYDNNKTIDDKIEDRQMQIHLKSLIMKYVQTFDCLPYIYDKARIVEEESSDEDGYYD